MHPRGELEACAGAAARKDLQVPRRSAPEAPHEIVSLASEAFHSCHGVLHCVGEAVARDIVELGEGRVPSRDDPCLAIEARREGAEHREVDVLEDQTSALPLSVDDRGKQVAATGRLVVTREEIPRRLVRRHHRDAHDLAMRMGLRGPCATPAAPP